MGDEGEVVAVELDPRRGARTCARTRRASAPAACEVVVGDASRPDHGSGYDRVLVDPPCSDLGTLQSRPDARWRKTPEQVERAGARCSDGSSTPARPRVRPGGRLVYSTCTISAARERAPDGGVPASAIPSLGLTTDRPIRSDSCRTATARTGSSSRPSSDMDDVDSRAARQPAIPRAIPFRPDRSCPSCGEPWLRPTQLAGRYRCVYCLTRFQLMAYCPACGEHSTIVRMSDTDQMECVRCGGSMLKPV